MTCEVSYQYEFILIPMLRCSVGIIHFKTVAWECGSTAETLESQTCLNTLPQMNPAVPVSLTYFTSVVVVTIPKSVTDVIRWPLFLLIPLADRVTYLRPSFSLGLVLPIYLQKHSSVLQFGINKHCASTCKSVQCSKTHGLHCLQFYTKPNGAFKKNM